MDKKDKVESDDKSKANKDEKVDKSDDKKDEKKDDDDEGLIIKEEDLVSVWQPGAHGALSSKHACSFFLGGLIFVE